MELDTQYDLLIFDNKEFGNETASLGNTAISLHRPVPIGWILWTNSCGKTQIKSPSI